MSDDFKKLGDVLKQKREAMNLSLKEVENATSIRAHHLDSIEQGKVDEFLSNVYAMGFIRQYAIFLGIDFEGIARDNPHAFKLPSAKHEFSYGIGTLEVRGSMGGGVKWLPNLVWASVAAGVIVVAWFFAKFMGIF